MDFAGRVVRLWQAALGSELLGAYLMGSLAHGGFSRRYSDIDMAVVTEAGISTHTLDRVRVQAAAMSADWGSNTNSTSECVDDIGEGGDRADEFGITLDVENGLLELGAHGVH